MIFLKKNYINTIGVVIIAISIITIITTKQIILIPVFGLIFIMLLLILFFQRKSFERELESVSNTIQNVMDNQQEFFLEENIEELNSKISHQLNKLSSWVNEYNKKVIKDKNNIQELITEIAHQLRTPLLNIETYSNLLLEDNTDENKNKYVNAVIASEEKIHFLIESFIKMSRFENKIIKIKKLNDNLNKTILNAILQVYDKAKEKNIEILYNQLEDIKVNHDSNWIEEAIYNVLDNSVKYSPINSKIEIKLSKNDMFTEIQIRDYGIGIESGEENKVFKRFYRGEKVFNKEGFGIGLYLTREIILKHEGFIKVKQKEKGLEMQIYL